MNKSHKETSEKTNNWRKLINPLKKLRNPGKKNKQLKEMNRIVQDLKMEIDAIKKIQSEGTLEM